MALGQSVIALTQPYALSSDTPPSATQRQYTARRVVSKRGRSAVAESGLTSTERWTVYGPKTDDRPMRTPTGPR